MVDCNRFRRSLLAWYRRVGRKLPWRSTSNPYLIWVSEIMLQQTRVAAVVPFFLRFVERFPEAASLARATEAEVLRHWSGLGYYTRARNLHRAAQMIARNGSFPASHAAIRALPGVGDYTAAAVASIAFGLPHAVVDGNVVRVLSRVACTNEGLKELAAGLLDRSNPGDYNQALMELGATVCLPRNPDCGACPLAGACQAREQGRQAEFPARRARPAPVRIGKTLLLVERNGRLLLHLVRGFWELPESAALPAAVLGEDLGSFRHAIMNRNYRFTVVAAGLRGRAAGLRTVPIGELAQLPLSTVTRKALGLWNNSRSGFVNR